MPVLVRTAMPQDAQAIAEIIRITHHEEAHSEQIQGCIESGEHFSYVAVSEGENIVGFVDGFITTSIDRAKRIEIDLLSVLLEFSGQGIAKQLIRKISEQAVEADFVRVLVNTENTPMHHVMRATDYELQEQICGLYVATDNGENIELPQEAHLIPVETFTYSGIWLEGEISKEAIHAAQYECKKRGFDIVGTVIPTQNAEAVKTVQNAGFEHVKDFQWWVRHAPFNPNRDYIGL